MRSLVVCERKVQGVRGRNSKRGEGRGNQVNEGGRGKKENMLRSLSLQNVCRNKQQFEEQIQVYKSVDMMDICPFLLEAAKRYMCLAAVVPFLAECLPALYGTICQHKTGERLPEGAKSLMSLKTEHDIAPKFGSFNVFRLY